MTQPTIAFTDCRYRKRKSVVQIFLTSSVFSPPLHGVNAVKRKEESRAGNKKMTYSTIVLYSSMFSVEILIDSFTLLFHRGGLRTVGSHKNCIDKFYKEQFDIWQITYCQSVNDANFMTLNLLLANIKFLTTNNVFEFSVLSDFLHPFKILCLGYFLRERDFRQRPCELFSTFSPKKTQHSPANSVSYAG